MSKHPIYRRRLHNKMRRLQQIHDHATHYRDQMDGLATEACELLGVNPDVDCDERDIAYELVDHGTSVSDVLKQLSEHRQLKIRSPRDDSNRV